MVGRGLLLLGFVCLAVVVLTHVAEWLRVFPGMGWGLRSSPGHYLDFVSAVLGCALLIVGMIWISFNTRRSSWCLKRRFPPPWFVEELDACFVVRDHGGQGARLRRLLRGWAGATIGGQAAQQRWGADGLRQYC
jgi:hypothetical protein